MDDSPAPDRKRREPERGQARQSQIKQPRARFAPEYEVLLRRLIALRKERGLTQIGMAKALGKTQSHVSMCENRERELSVIDVWRWAKAVGLKWSELAALVEQEAEIEAPRG